MELNFEEMLEKITQFIKSETRTETVIGDQFTLGEFSCVPVIKVGMGFGTGGGTGKDPKSGEGQGGGAGAEEISFVGTGKSKGISAIFDKMPDFMEKFMEKKDKDKKKETTA